MVIVVFQLTSKQPVNENSYRLHHLNALMQEMADMAEI